MVLNNLHHHTAPLAMDFLNINQDKLVLVQLDDESLDTVLAGTTRERKNAVWSNPNNADREDGLAPFVRANFPSEEDLGRFLARADLTEAEKIKAIGEIQIEIGRLEFLLGVLYLGGNNQSWENLSPRNSNRGDFVNHYKREMGNRPNGMPWCTMFAGYLKRITGFEDGLSTTGSSSLVFNSGMRFDRWGTDGFNLLSGRDNFSDPSDFEDYSGASIDQNDWKSLRRSVNARGITREQKEEIIDTFFSTRITPQAGDILIKSSGNSNNYSGPKKDESHTVTVETYNNYIISTIEGNQSHRLMGTEINLLDANDIAHLICLIRVGTEFYTENEVPEAEGQIEEEQIPISSEDILIPLRHMVRNLQLMADRRNYIGDGTEGALIFDMSGATGGGTR